MLSFTPHTMILAGNSLLIYTRLNLNSTVLFHFSYHGTNKSSWRLFRLSFIKYMSNVTIFLYGILGLLCVPSNVTVRDVQTTSVLLSWNRCFHGCLNPAFIIQLSTDTINWTNVTTVNDSQRSASLSYKLHSLEGSSTYHVRLVAFYEACMSNYSTSYKFTTKGEERFNDYFTF